MKSTQHVSKEQPKQPQKNQDEKSKQKPGKSK